MVANAWLRLEPSQWLGMKYEFHKRRHFAKSDPAWDSREARWMATLREGTGDVEMAWHGLVFAYQCLLQDRAYRRGVKPEQEAEDFVQTLWLSMLRHPPKAYPGLEVRRQLLGILRENVKWWHWKRSRRGERDNAGSEAEAVGQTTPAQPDVLRDKRPEAHADEQLDAEPISPADTPEDVPLAEHPEDWLRRYCAGAALRTLETAAPDKLQLLQGAMLSSSYAVLAKRLGIGMSALKSRVDETRKLLNEMVERCVETSRGLWPDR